MKTNQQNHIDAATRILVVEDDRSVRRMLRFSLREAGFEISEATTGGEALLSLQADVPRAVVLDLGLPDGLGGAVLDWLRRYNNTLGSCLVWIVISAQDQSDIVRQYGPLGRHFMAKPFNPWDLVTRLQELLAEGGSPGTN